MNPFYKKSFPMRQCFAWTISGDNRAGVRIDPDRRMSASAEILVDDWSGCNMHSRSIEPRHLPEEDAALLDAEVDI
jgi:hypothetical protein